MYAKTFILNVFLCVCEKYTVRKTTRLGFGEEQQKLIGSHVSQI